MADRVGRSALVVVDMQRGFDDPVWGATTNLDCEANVVALLEAWNSAGEPVVVVRHDSEAPDSPLHPDAAGNALVASVAAARADVLITKNVNSAFYGQPDLHGWLRERGIEKLVICGIQTNMCVETSARMAGNLGYEVTVALDATRTFDLSTEIPGLATVTRSADELMATTALVLQAGGFAQISTTADVVRTIEHN